MNAETVLDNVGKIANDFAADRKERQRRRYLDPADFARLAEAGYLLAGVPEARGGLWRSVRESTRPLCGILRVLAQPVSATAANVVAARTSLFIPRYSSPRIWRRGTDTMVARLCSFNDRCARRRRAARHLI